MGVRGRKGPMPCDNVRANRHARASSRAVLLQDLGAQVVEVGLELLITRARENAFGDDGLKLGGEDLEVVAKLHGAVLKKAAERVD